MSSGSGTVARARRICSVVILAVACAVAVAAPAAGQDLDDRADVAVALDVDGYVVTSDSRADINDVEALAAAVDPATVPWYLVFSGPVDESPSVIAEDLRARLAPASVVVMAELVDDSTASFDVGVASDAYDDAAIDAILDGAANRLGDDSTPVEVAAAILASAESVPASVPSSGGAASGENPAGGSGGGSGVVVLVVLVVIAAAAVVGVVVMRRRIRSRETRDVENARAEIAEQLAVVANEILDNADRVKLSGDERAIDAYRLASTAYSEVADAIDTTTDLIELGVLNDRIDEARWRIEVAEAIVEGREPPPEPVDEHDRAACFFDPTHRAGTHSAVIDEGGRERTVRVCSACRDRLDRGEKPEPRLVTVGKASVPAARAPRSHGGLGLGGLDVFDVIGAGTRMPHTWGQPSRRRSPASRSGGGRPAGSGRRRMGGGSAGRGRRRF
ncbi:MAG: hypothetical protein RIE08_17195 [Acidimicrobiales bacterium]